MDNILPELEQAIKQVIEAHTSEETRFGWVGMNLAQRMAEAANAVLLNNYELNKYLEDEKLLKYTK